jgi:hypothetical protein
MIPLHPHKNVIKIKKWTKMNIMIKFKRKAMIKGEMRMMGIKIEATKTYTTTPKSVPHRSKRSLCG